MLWFDFHPLRFRTRLLAIISASIWAAVCAMAGTPGNPWASYRYAPDALQEIDLASDTAWILSVDGGPVRPIKVPGGGWNSDQQEPQIQVMRDVRDYVTYERQITVPRIHGGQVVKVLFGAVNYGAEVYCDGTKVAEHHVSILPFEADITSCVKGGGEHTLTVKAYHRRHYYRNGACNVPVGWDFPGGADEASRKEAKAWCSWAGNSKVAYGITRYVRLAILPALYVDGLLIRTSVTRRELQYGIRIHNTTDRVQEVKLAGKLSSWNSRSWEYPRIPETRATVPPGGEVEVTSVPVMWNLGPESYWWPNIPFREDYAAQLHWLDLQISAGDTVCQKIRRRFGFVEHAEGPYYYTINGVRVTGIGEGAAEGQLSYYDSYTEAPAFQPPGGSRSGCAETWRRYMRIGINSMRLHCSPPTEYLMETADEVGFLLVPEVPIWGNGLSQWDPVNHPQAVQEMGSLCRNHPSVARYSLTNEVSDRLSPSWPWRALIDAMIDVDPTRPLTFELDHRGVGKIDGVTKGHAYIMEHYGDITAKGGDFIRGEGEQFWKTDGMTAFALGCQTMRLNDWTYMAAWSWINYWPNFLEGMNNQLHAWKPNNHPDRTDGVDGWDSPVVRFVQKSFHPYLLVDRDILKTNPAAQQKSGQLSWPVNLPNCSTGESVDRAIEAFNGGLTSGKFMLKWSAHWDDPAGPEALPGGEFGPFSIEAGFHSTQHITFTVPAAGQPKRRLYLLLESLKDGAPVFREDRIYLNVESLTAPSEMAN